MKDFDFNIKEYDLSSLGERFSFEAGGDYPFRVGLGSSERQHIFQAALNRFSREIAEKIVSKKMISVKNGSESFSVRVDFVVVPMQEFYEMLGIIEKATGRTHFNYK